MARVRQGRFVDAIVLCPNFVIVSKDDVEENGTTEPGSNEVISQRLTSSDMGSNRLHAALAIHPGQPAVFHYCKWSGMLVFEIVTGV
jgi:hypothetical protein